MGEENKQEEVSEEVVEGQEQEVKPTADELLKNREAELARKNREIERMRTELAMRQNEPVKRDQNDISTWADHELKTIVNSNDPSVMPYKEKANEILLDRKVDARLARKLETEKKVTAEMQLRQQFPEALDPSSDLAIKMDQIISEHDLSKTPAGRLVAAKLAAAELGQGKNTSDAKKTKSEQNRVTRVKGQMVDGDRPKPTGNESSPDKQKAFKEKLLSEKRDDFKAVGDWMDSSGLREKFNKVWGQ